MNAFEQPGGLNAVIHSSVAVSYAEDDKKTIVFGKLASFSKTNSKRQAIRTIWSARFDEVGHATAFFHLIRSMAQDSGDLNEENDNSDYNKEATATKFDDNADNKQDNNNWEALEITFFWAKISFESYETFMIYFESILNLIFTCD